MCQVDRLTAPRVATPGPPLRHRSCSDERRAVPPGPFREPAAVLVEQCVGQHEELAHDDDHRDLPRLSLRDELTILRAQVRVVTGRRQCRHVEQPPRPAALDEAAALPGAGLPSNGREACQAGDRLGVEAAELRHLGQQARRGDARHARGAVRRPAVRRAAGPAAGSRSPSRRGRSRSACIANGRLRHTGKDAVRRAPPCVVSRVGFSVL